MFRRKEKGMRKFAMVLALAVIAAPIAATAQHPPGHGQNKPSHNNGNGPGNRPPGHNSGPGPGASHGKPSHNNGRPPAPGKPSHSASHGGKYYPDQHYRPGSSRDRYRIDRNTRIYRGGNGRYYCRRNDGSTGLIVGAAVGGLLGNALGDGDSGVLSTILGAGVGGALGREIDRGNVYCE
jgi:hypothetical protein